MRELDDIWTPQEMPEGQWIALRWSRASGTSWEPAPSAVSDGTLLIANTREELRAALAAMGLERAPDEVCARAGIEEIWRWPSSTAPDMLWVDNTPW